MIRTEHALGPDSTRQPAPPPGRTAVIASVASAFPERAYSQEEIGTLLGLENRVVKKLLRSPHIQRRHLYLPEKDPGTGRARSESAADLHAKFRAGTREIGSRAILEALDSASLSPSEVDYMLCVTSSGFMVPGLSSLFSRELGFNRNLLRADVVGMGCNAGLNGMNPLVQWVRNHPGGVALLVCCEVNSAIYVLDDSPRTGIVNSLFGDGAAAAVLTGSDGQGPSPRTPSVVDFESFCVPEQWAAMRFDWNADAGKWSFYIDRDIPYVIGFNIREPVEALLKRNGLDFSAVKHWVLHTGGGAVIDSVKLNLGLTEHDVRHTRSVLHDYGNISSGSFLVSLQRLLAEGRTSAGDIGVMVTMGPGAQIETALLEFGPSGKESPCPKPLLLVQTAVRHTRVLPSRKASPSGSWMVAPMTSPSGCAFTPEARCGSGRPRVAISARSCTRTTGSQPGSGAFSRSMRSRNSPERP